MSVRVIAVGLILAAGVGLSGCKTAPKLAWWKKTDSAELDSSTLARTAPTLPSEVAQQGQTATTAANQNAGSYDAAPPFTGSTSAPVASYPNTGVQGYVPPITPSEESSVASTAPKFGSEPSTSMPYNPSAVPPPAYAATSPESAPASAAAPASRYAATGPTTGQDAPAYTASTAASTSFAPSSAATETPTSANATAPAPAASSSVASTSLADRYGASSATTTAPAGSPSGVATASPLGNRYAATISMDAAGSADEISPSSYKVEEQATSTPLATSSPFRPGGTSTYPGGSGSSGYEVATRPDAAPATTPGGASEPANTATPAGPRYR